MKTTIVTVGADGTLRMIYDDAHADLLAQGEARIRRASHVEPHPTRSGWLADLRPVGGPILGAEGRSVEGYEPDEECLTAALLPPFPTRQQALDAEVAWLTAHVL